MTSIVAAPLDPAAFAPFGTVSRAGPEPGAATIAGAFEGTAEAAIPILQLARIVAVEQPFTLRRLERHPFSAQSFVPLDGIAAIIVVAPSGPDGEPDLGRLKAFVAAGDQVVTYARGVWHQSLTPLSTPAAFAMVMRQTGRGDDTELRPLAEPVRIEMTPV
jgi:ureidoglycolate lyase